MLLFLSFLLWVSPIVLAKKTGSTNSSCKGAECLPKTWHNVSCRINDDCDAHHTVCYQRVCRCAPGYFYTTHDTCTNTCRPDDMHDNFTDYPDSALRANLLYGEDRLTVEVCKGRCQTDKTCLTFDFKAHGGLCRLHNVTSRDSPSDWSPKRSKGWTHYQKSCKSTFASHHTWYNLLCNSKVDCPDLNSDCLSGRCLCNLGFKFNDTMKECDAPSELIKWHNVSCMTDNDCDEPHAVCYKRQCQCDPGYFFTTPFDICTSTCSKDELQNNFTEYPDSALRGNHLASWDGVSLKDCKDRCLTDTRCLTFDFKANGRLCRLHNVTALESPSNWSPKRSKDWTHYQRSCKSIFASHHTWYNLLCNTRMDCPDPNSDCLAGRCLCHSGFNFNEATKECHAPRTCQDWQATGARSGVYTIQLPNNKPLRVWCDMESSGGGWLVIQRRRDNSVNFHRNWTEYENGFGNISGDFWLGLSTLHILSYYGDWRLRVDFIAESGTRHWAQYGWFYVDSPRNNYALHADGYSGDAGGGMGIYKGSGFQTYDRNEYGCFTSSKGGWWYHWPDCSSSTNLNSYHKSRMTWGDIGRVTFSEMKMKPRV